MEQLIFIQTGMGIDAHGQNVTKASVRAIKNAIQTNSMPGIQNKSLIKSLEENMKVNVKLAVPRDKGKIEVEKIKRTIPYGTVSVEVIDGGMVTTSGYVLREGKDKNDKMYMVNAAVEVGY